MASSKNVPIPLALVFVFLILVLAAIMVAAIVQASKGKIVAINTIKCIGIIGIPVSILAALFINIPIAVMLLLSSVLYYNSSKNINFAKVGAAIYGAIALIYALLLFLRP